VVVNDIPNPYKAEHKFEKRFEFTLNKIYAWSLTEYQRVVMIDVDNLFLRAPDELFQCGQFCAAFINPCIFHTGLFVLQVCSLLRFPLSDQLVRSCRESS
jgi:alpha-N-acetylglucosamine transferase